MTAMTPTQARVAQIFADFIGLEFVDVHDDVYALGADSIEAVRIALQIEREFDVELPVDVLEMSGSVEDVAAWIDARKAT